MCATIVVGEEVVGLEVGLEEEMLGSGDSSMVMDVLHSILSFIIADLFIISVVLLQTRQGNMYIYRCSHAHTPLNYLSCFFFNLKLFWHFRGGDKGTELPVISLVLFVWSLSVANGVQL